LKRIALLLASIGITLTLAACGGGADATSEEATVREAVAFLPSTEGSPGVFVRGRDIVVSYAQRPPTYADQVRKAALDASRATNGRRVMLYVIDSAEAPTAVPGDGQYYCRIEAFDSRMAGNTC
jgi:hypothetical protein